MKIKRYYRTYHVISADPLFFCKQTAVKSYTYQKKKQNKKKKKKKKNKQTRN